MLYKDCCVIIFTFNDSLNSLIQSPFVIDNIVDRIQRIAAVPSDKPISKQNALVDLGGMIQAFSSAQATNVQMPEGCQLLGVSPECLRDGVRHLCSSGNRMHVSILYFRSYIK